MFAAADPAALTTASVPAPPPRALALAYAGLLPFVVGAALVWLVRADAYPFVTLALSAYAAVVVSFLGGIHWGLLMHSTSALAPEPLVAKPRAGLAWGVVPALVAWVAVMMPPSAGLVVHGVMLVACYLVDRRLYPLYGAAHWLTLRFRLSGVAALSCFVGAAGA